MTTHTPTTPQETPVNAKPRPRDHHVIAEGPSRLALCGAIPPWDPDAFTCSAGAWGGEDTCPACGGPMCASCLRVARTS